MDSLLATVQMPAGIPGGGRVAIGKPGATNAGFWRADDWVGDEAIAKKLEEHKEKLARGVEEKSKKLRSS